MNLLKTFLIIFLCGAASSAQEMIPYRKGDLWGFSDRSRNIIISSKYDYVEPFKNGFAKVGKNDLTGFIDATGKEIVPVEYAYAGNYSDGLFAVQKGDKWGYVDAAGKTVIPFIYGYGQDFNNGAAIISNDWVYGIIDKTGKLIVPVQYGTAEHFSDNLVKLLFEKKFYFADHKGKVSKALPYNYIGYLNDGLAFVRRSSDSKWGYIDSTGKEVIPCRYLEGKDFNNGRAIVQTEKGTGVIDTKGNFIIQPKYSSIDDMFGGFNNGIASARRDTVTILLKENGGEIPLPGGYSLVGQFKEGMMSAYVNNKLTFINEKGETVIPPTDKYNNVYPFDDGVTAVGKGNRSFTKWGYIDKSGQEIIPLQYDEAKPFKKGVAIVKKGNMWGLIDKTGKEVTPLKYGDLKETFDFKGIYEVKIKGKSGYIDSSGMEYFE
ncbi:MAG: WG repeat-containing protein [Bacteroidota bacterium]